MPPATTGFAARHFPHFIHLLNEVVSESHRWAKNQIRSTIAIKLGSFDSSPRIAELLVGGLNGIRDSNFTKAVSPEKNTIPMQDLDVPKLPLIDVKLLGNVSQEYREKITAMGTSTIKTTSNTINQVVDLTAMGDHSYEHGDFVQAREQYSIARSLADIIICRMGCRGYGSRLIFRTELIVRAMKVSVRNSLALAKTNNQLGFGDSVANLLVKPEWTIAGQGKLVPVDSNLLADFYWN